VCIDDLSTGSLSNINDFVGNPNFAFLEQDVTAPIKIHADEIYNLACPASPVHYQKDPIKTLQTSVLGAMNMLELARICGAKILQASTSEVYGDPLVHPQIESYCGNVNSVGPRSCYDEGKRCAETMFSDYRRTHGLDTRIARIFNTYGPRQLPNDGRVVSSFVCQALNGLPISVFGSGLQTRSFCFVDDTVEALLRLMNHKYCSGPINIGSEDEIPVLELARLTIRLTKSTSRIVHYSLPQDDPCRRRPDISMASEVLDWSPRIGLIEGLKKTISYFRDQEIGCSGSHELLPAKALGGSH
jgi:UDP-glucuronate decarboxylase